MGFAAAARQEVAHHPPDRDCCRRAQLQAFVDAAGSLTPPLGRTAGRLVVRLGSPAAARSLCRLLRASYAVTPRVAHSMRAVRGRHQSPRRSHRRVRVIVNGLGQRERLVRDLLAMDRGLAIPWRPCCRRAYLGGAFLAGGSITEPGRGYHLEIDVARGKAAATVAGCADSLGIATRIARRHGRFVVYLKDAGQIADFLGAIGAHTALLELENVRVMRDVRNRVNRLVNCETANVDKTVRAALRQIERIQRLIDARGLWSLPPTLAALAQARLSHPYASLKELGELMDPPVSKSTISYRMARLLDLEARLERSSGAESEYGSK
ncbi:MAG TPA: DNA-binding protein WhiA [Limnochordia bacterium]